MNRDPVPVDALAWMPWGDQGLRVVVLARSSRLPLPLMEARAPFTELMALTLPTSVGVVLDDLAHDPGKLVGHSSESGQLVPFDPAFLGPLAFLSAAWALMFTPTVSARRTLEPASSSSSAGAEAKVESPQGRVTLIDLRPMRHIEDDEPGHSGRTYRHRWIVRGHWRHQPHGPARAHRRLTWVPSYTKGPSSAPLVHSEKVMVWRR